ncbi:hypothetical protein D023_3569B, partial [Vibrio parahaemolyticus 3256]
HIKASNPVPVPISKI